TPPPISPLFPYTTLFRSHGAHLAAPAPRRHARDRVRRGATQRNRGARPSGNDVAPGGGARIVAARDRRAPARIPRGHRAARARGAVLQGDQRRRGCAGGHGDVAPVARPQTPPRGAAFGTAGALT